MLGTSSPEQKKNRKVFVPVVVHTYNCTKNASTGCSPYYLLYVKEPRLTIDIEFVLQEDSQNVPPSKSHYVEQLRRRLKYVHRRPKKLASKQQERHKGLYDQSCWQAELEVGNLVIVRPTVWKGRHKIPDRLEDKNIR